MTVARALPALLAMMIGSGALAAAEKAPAGARTDASGWHPFDVGLDGMPGGIDVGALLFHRPAGRYGFLTAKDGHFRFQKGDKPARFWGTNFTVAAAFPPKEDAPKLARHLARLGFNSVRFHHINNRILDASYDDTQHLSAEAMDRLDYFLHQLKQNGIYVNLNLLTNRWGSYKKGDNVVDYQKLDKGQRVVHFFDPRLIALQKDFARQLLSHRNSYTGLRYADDPAIAFVEIINETSFFGSGETGENSKLPPYYARQLDALFNQWVRARYPDTEALRAAWGGLEAEEEYGSVRRVALRWPQGGEPSRRVQDTARFYLHVETTYYQDMARYLRQDLGFQGQINGTNNWSGMATLKAQTVCDYTDIHGYLDHPAFPQANWDRNNFELFQVAAVNHPEGYFPDHPRSWRNIVPVHKWPLGGVAGMPLVSSEWNWAFPNRHGYEGALLVSAYGALQDVSGFYQFTYDNALEQRTGFFNLQPNLLVQMPVAALAFLRGDVRPARETVELAFTDEEVIAASLKNGTAYTHNAEPALPLSAALVHGIRKRFAGDGSGSDRIDRNRLNRELQNPYRSDTGELVWDSGDNQSGVVTVGTAKLQGAAGFLLGKEIRLGEVVLRPRTDGAISVISVDGRPLGQSREMLLTAVGRQENTGQVWKAGYRGVADWGRPPVLLEPVRGEIEIATVGRNVDVYALDEKGERKRRVPSVATDKGIRFTIGGDKTAWYKVEAR